MDMNSLLIGIIIGSIVGAVVVYFWSKSSSVKRKDYEELNHKFIRKSSEFENASLNIKNLENILLQKKDKIILLNKELQEFNNQITTLTKENEILKRDLENLNELNLQQKDELKTYQTQKENLLAENQKLIAQNDSLDQLLKIQKEETVKTQKMAKEEFQNLAQKILDEKTEKFTHLNESKLKGILEPFQEKIVELKNRVNDAYEKENKERFSLAQKVKELADLNLQISDDAKKLTRALKGESKTQGNWGEMILESILEKSGLVKGREYFLEHQLNDDDNKALHSQFSGKKMRPDAVIKYPDNRDVIVDSKVSLTAFADLIDETDAEVIQIKIKQHLDSIRNHINQLSQKAYDDYGKSLDFVIMFIPSEPAYIRAMQADPHIWSYAYERRILLLSPTNLITSLKLIADLWKREYQNKNTLEIADRGAKLYDKFVGFIDSLEKVGKDIDKAKTNYDTAYKQLYTGRDNLVVQTEKLKKLGIKSKKEISKTLLDNAETNEIPLTND